MRWIHFDDCESKLCCTCVHCQGLACSAPLKEIMGENKDYGRVCKSGEEAVIKDQERRWRERKERDTWRTGEERWKIFVKGSRREKWSIDKVLRTVCEWEKENVDDDVGEKRVWEEVRRNRIIGYVGKGGGSEWWIEKIRGWERKEKDDE